MKISIGTRIKEGPWGGGNLFAVNLRNHLISKGYEVVFDLEDDDIDIILMTEPRKTSESSAYTHKECLDYKKFVKKDTVIIHRINECDERKGTNFVNKYIIYTNQIADHTVFVSNWLKDLYVEQGLKNLNLNVILGGADDSIFNSSNFKPYNGKEKIRIVTHHWGANWNKGFEVYQKLDEMVSQPEWKEIIEFTYIGNLPNKFSFKNSNYIEPLSGEDLVKELKKNNLYITASLNEPSGNHHMEGALCGLPILYINSGGTPEYCEGYGLSFEMASLEQKIYEFKKSYKNYNEKMNNYPHKSKKMCEQYEKLFHSTLEQKNKIRKFKASNSEKKFYSFKKKWL